MKFLLFGTGDYYERYKKWFIRDDVLALLDNSPDKQNTALDGLCVLAPEEGIKLPYDAIVILSFYVKEMRQQLTELGVPASTVYHFYDLHGLIYSRENKKRIEYYGDAEKVINSGGSDLKEKKVLLLSHDLTLGGPSIALYHAARILLKHEYRVVYASMLDGPLKEKLLLENIPVVVDVNLQIEKMANADWTKEFSLIICNTINYHVFLSERDTGIPVIWWLHDASFFYDGIHPDALRSLSRKNLKVYSVGPIPGNAIKKLLPDLYVERLLYGVEDTVSHNGGVPFKRNKVCFVIIGYVGEIKGHDILIEAIHDLTANIRQEAIFYFVGQNTSVIARQLSKKAEDIPEIVMTGPVGRDGVHQILEDADVLICPSREDSMPTVAAEAMMHCVPCIVSDATGTAEYITNGVDGLIIPNQDIQALSEKIEWCVKNRPNLRRMGEKARRVYEKVFSLEAFEERLMEIVGHV